jgi:tRNA (cmo5U34)-methyltransferase
LYGAAVEIVDETVPEAGRVLDLGAGTGLLSRLLLRARPDVRVTLLDGDAAMLGRARSHLGPSVPIVHGDLRSALPDAPEGRWHAVVSALAIHHLEHDEKRSLFRRIRGALGDGGVFVNAEQILGRTPWLQARTMRRWEEEARRLGSDDDEIARAYLRFELDRDATVGAQLAWLSEAGFTHADCTWKHERFAVLAAFT